MHCLSTYGSKTAVILAALIAATGCVVEARTTPGAPSPAPTQVTASTIPAATGPQTSVPLGSSPTVVPAPANPPSAVPVTNATVAASPEPTEIPVTAPPRDTSPEPFSLLVSEFPPGPTIPPSAWGGVLRYTFTKDGTASGAVRVIDKSQVADPCGLALRPKSHELFVANRHGNIAGDGVAGSISRFIWNPTTHTVSPNGTITGNGLNSVHQVVFSPTSGELFASNWLGNVAVSRFVFDAKGQAIPHGTIGSGRGGGVAISPDGKRLYVTNGGPELHQYDLTSGAELSVVRFPNVSNLGPITRRDSELYIADFYGGALHRFGLNASDEPVFKDTVTGADKPMGAALSDDGQHLFTAAHYTGVIDHFRYEKSTGSWTLLAKTKAPGSLGSALVIEEHPAH